MKKGFLLILSLSTGGALAQAPSHPSQPPLTPTTRFALQALQEKAQKVGAEVQELQQIVVMLDQDIRKQYPGFHLNNQTLGVEEDAPVLAPAAPSPTPKQPK